jgi:hypothetical protein
MLGTTGMPVKLRADGTSLVLNCRRYCAILTSLPGAAGIAGSACFDALHARGKLELASFGFVQRCNRSAKLSVCLASTRCIAFISEWS